MAKQIGVCKGEKFYCNMRREELPDGTFRCELANCCDFIIVDKTDEEESDE